MAMIKLSAGSPNIAGKIGGDVYREDQCGHHIQAKPPYRSSHFWKPTPQKRGFTQAKNVWMNHDWTKEELNMWWVWCADHPQKNKKGETVYFHPFIGFLSVNIKRILKHLPPTIRPPNYKPL